MAMRYIKVTTPSFITPIGMYGPIITPISMAENVALRCVTAGYKTFEVNVEKKIQLELDVINFYDENRWNTGKVTDLNGKPIVNKVAKETPKPVENPVVKEPIKPEVTPIEEESKTVGAEPAPVEEIKEEMAIEEPTVDIDTSTEENIENDNLNKKNKKNKKK